LTQKKQGLFRSKANSTFFPYIGAGSSPMQLVVLDLDSIMPVSQVRRPVPTGAALLRAPA